MKIYLLPVKAHLTFFYADDPMVDWTKAEEDASTPKSSDPSFDSEFHHWEKPTTPKSRFRQWLEQGWRQVHYTLHEAEGGVAGKTRRVWEWLHSFTSRDEPMLARLRSIRRVDLFYPANHSQDEIETRWRAYLSRRRWKHLFCLSYNTILVPPTVLLAILPGPNLIGYWFAYRAIHHWLLLRGINKVRKNRIPTVFHAEQSLISPVSENHPALSCESVGNTVDV